MLVKDGKNQRTNEDKAVGLEDMYATRLAAGIYHLVQPNRKQTLCGLRISRVISERRVNNTLQLVRELTPNLTICKHCARIQRQDLKA